MPQVKKYRRINKDGVVYTNSSIFFIQNAFRPPKVALTEATGQWASQSHHSPSHRKNETLSSPSSALSPIRLPDASITLKRGYYLISDIISRISRLHASHQITVCLFTVCPCLQQKVCAQLTEASTQFRYSNTGRLLTGVTKLCHSTSTSGN
jgi:hypothetical protein